MAAAKPKQRAVKFGRPTAYKPEFADQAAKLCKKGLTDFEIAQFFNVTDRTLGTWKNKYPDFLLALKSGKDVSDERVERSLFHRAIGYSFEAEEIFQYQGKVVRAKVIKHVPPDTTAMIFWLKNRRKDTWRDVQRHEHGGPGAFSQLTDEELAQKLVEVGQLMLAGPVIEHEEDET